jgi:YYY domain-containing protein
MMGSLLSWTLLSIFLGAISFPLAYRLFSKLPDRGYTFNRILGLLLWGFFFWILTSFNLLQNRPGGILFALSLLVAASIWAGWGRWKRIWNWVKSHWRLILASEIVFLTALCFMALVRASNPEATGTEKPMELAFINAILNSDSFPPKDPWLSGYAISYYHFGYILAAMIAKMTFTSGGVAFNLMLSLVFGMSALGAYGVLYNLLVSSKKVYKKGINNLGWALFGPMFLLFVSNLEAILEMLHQAGIAWDMTGGTSRFWEWINIESLNIPPRPPLTPIPQRFWWWWQASRVIQDIDLQGVVSPLSPIDEFPAFSFVLGDLHPHVLVMPFVMLLIGMAINVYLGGMRGKTKIFGLKLPFRLEQFALGAVVLGGIAFLNTWDLPVYFALFTGAFVLNRVKKKGWHWNRLSEFLSLAFPLGIFSLLLYLPFFLSFQSQAGGILPNIYYPTRGLYLWVMFGPLFIPIFLFFAWLFRKRKRAEWRLGLMVTLILVLLLYIISILLGFVVSRMDLGQQLIASQGESSFGGLVLSALGHRLSYGFSLLTLFLLLGVGLAYLFGLSPRKNLGKEMRSPLPFVLLMIVLGGVMVLAPEFVFLRDNFGARMNTIFKFYYQAWMLWSLAAAFGAVWVMKKGALISRLLVILFVILGLVYPVFAYLDKTNAFQPPTGYTLDASAYMAQYQPDEAAAINWLSQAPDGVVAEAIGGQYSGYARVSTLSGQPAVLGWPGHEGQWRGGYEEVGSREPDIRTLYETPNWDSAQEIIRRYQIRYIFVGGLEMSTYALNINKFEQNLSIGFQLGNVSVFVVPETLLN